MTPKEAAILADFDREGGCPVDWSAEIGVSAGSKHARIILDLEWVRAVDSWAFDGGEARFVEEVQLFDGPLLGNYDELVPATKNLGLRRQRIVAEYLAVFGRFASLTFISPAQHNAGKHVRLGKRLEEIVAATAGGAPSLFLQNYSADELRSAFWTWINSAFGLDIDASFANPDEENFCIDGAGPFWRSFLTTSSRRFAFRSMAIIGASDGEATDCVCFDISFGAQTVHAFPVTERKAVATNPAGFPLLGVEFGWQ